MRETIPLTEIVGEKMTEAEGRLIIVGVRVSAGDAEAKAGVMLREPLTDCEGTELDVGELRADNV